MQLIDSYSLYKHDTSTKTKYLLKSFSGVYDPLHRPSKRINEVPLYITSVPNSIKSNARRKPNQTLSGTGSTYISGIFNPDLNSPEIGYGDIRGTEDALLIITKESQAEILVFKGKKSVAYQLYTILLDPDIDLLEELEDHRSNSEDWVI